MKQRGSFLVEVLIAILIFTSGLLVLAFSLAYGARIIIDSGDNTILKQKLANLPEIYLLERSKKFSGATINPLNQIIEHNQKEISVVAALDDISLSIGGRTLSFKTYRYKLPDKKSSPFYILEKKQ